MFAMSYVSFTVWGTQLKQLLGRSLYKTKLFCSYIINFLKLLILINKTMSEKQMPLLERMRMTREMKLLQCELGDCLMQLQFKDTKIQELQRLLIQIQDKQIEQSIAVEEETQCSIDPEGAPQQRELVRRLNSMLKEREEQGVGLHLVTLEKEQEINALKVKLQQSQELADNLQQELNIQEGAITEQESVIDDMKNENDELRMQIIRLETALEEKQAELASQNENRQNLRILQENRVTLQHIIIQNQKQKQKQNLEQSQSLDESKLMCQLLEKEMASLLQEKEKMKKIINNYDWKLFCLETELDLSNKEKKQYKYVNDKHETKLAQYEATIKQMTIKNYSLEEEVKAIEEENKFYEAELDYKQKQIDELLVQKDTQETDALKQLQYRIQEKDEELKEITNYLKEKLNENHQIKLKCSQLEKNLHDAQKKAEKSEFESYQLEQCIIEHEEIMQKQSEKIDEFSRESEFMNGKINELSLMNILRVQEFEEKFSMMQNTIKEKSQKINELSVEIIERDIQFNKIQEEIAKQQEESSKKEEEINEIRSNLDECRSKCSNLKERLLETEANFYHLEMLINTKDKQIEKIVSKMNNLETTIKEKEKIIQFLQSQLKSAKNDCKEARLINRRYEQELEEMKEVMNVNEEKIKILKKEAVDYIDVQLNHEFEIEQLKKQMGKLEFEKSLLLQTQEKNEKEITAYGEALDTLRVVGLTRVEQIINHITKPAQSAEDTAVFEVLAEDDEDFESAEAIQEREKKELLDKLQAYSNEINEIYDKCYHE